MSRSSLSARWGAQLPVMGCGSRATAALEVAQSSNRILAQMSADFKESGSVPSEVRLMVRQCCFPDSISCFLSFLFKLWQRRADEFTG